MKRLSLLILVVLASVSLRAQSVEELLDSVAHGSLNCQVDLALHYLRGDGVLEDENKAFEMIKDAADKGNRYGELWLGLCYQQGVGTEVDYQAALRCLESSAQKGNVSALGQLGLTYLEGLGVEVDKSRAISYFQQGAAGGDLHSQYQLGLCYLSGIGVKADREKAFSFFAQIADQDFPEAKMLQALCYFNGWGTQADKEKAISLVHELSGELPQQQIDEIVSKINNDVTLKSYYFQFRLLPMRLANYQNNLCSEEELANIDLLRTELGSSFISHYEWDWDVLSTTVHQVSDSVVVYLIHMDKPKEMTDCKYVAFVIDKKNNKSRYYTLEKTLSFDSSIKDPWIVGSMATEGFTHYNYGLLEGEATEESFVKRILELFLKEK